MMYCMPAVVIMIKNSVCGFAKILAKMFRLKYQAGFDQERLTQGTIGLAI